MSREVLMQTVDKALKDTRFRSLLLKDPKRALSGLSLTREEYSALTQLTDESFKIVIQNIDPKAIVNMWSTYVNDAPSKDTLSRYNLTDLYNLTSR